MSLKSNGFTEAFAGILLLTDGFPPPFVVQIPLDGLADSGIEILLRFPAKFVHQLGWIDRIAQIVSGTVRHMRDQILVLAGLAGTKLIKNAAHGLDHLKIGALVVPADVVRLTGNALLVHKTKRGGMVIDIEPVTHVCALAIDRQRLSVETVQYDERNELFREMVWAIVVGAVRDENRKTIGIVPSAYKMIRSGLGGGIRGMGRVWSLLRKETLFSERAVHLIRADVLETERFLRRAVSILRQIPPIGKRRLKKNRRSRYVGADEFARAIDGAVNVRLCSKMENRVRAIHLKRGSHCANVADVGLEELTASRHGIRLVAFIVRSRPR